MVVVVVLLYLYLYFVMTTFNDLQYDEVCLLLDFVFLSVVEPSQELESAPVYSIAECSGKMENFF